MRKICLLFLVAGCGPQKAPTELNELTHYLYREWDDDAHMQEGVLNLDAQKWKLGGSTDDRSYQVSTLSKDDLAGVNWPMQENPGKAIGACVVRRSDWDLDDQVKLIQLPDQIDAEPSAKSYMRSFIDPTDPSCFTQQGCPTLLTDNDVTRDNSAITVHFLLHKNYRWVKLGSADDGGAQRWAIAARSNTSQPYKGTKSGTALDQSYGMDIFLGQNDGHTIRYQCSWSQTELGVDLDDGLVLAVLVSGVDSALAASDTAIQKHFH
jgi:hypothetical protein